MNYMHHAVDLWAAITDGGMTAYRLSNELKAAHEAGKREAQQWLPIEDAPIDGTPVLVRSPLWDQARTGYVFENDCWQCFPPSGTEPTHYMPLPPPPEDEL